MTENVVSGFSPLVDQKRPVRLLSSAISGGNLPQALLFTGINGIGKKTAALAFAMACNCSRRSDAKKDFTDRHPEATKTEPSGLEPCGHCQSCKKIISGNHPDIIFVKPTGAMIKVEQVRALCARLMLKPYEARIRCVIISDAQKLNPEAGNTLLKTLEEPPDHTVFILTALQASNILPTIVSRCQHIRFNPISCDFLRSYLINRHGIAASEASVIAAMADGSMTRADAMAQSGWTAQRKWIIDEVESLPSRPVNLCLAFSETLAKNKDQLSTAFDIMKHWFRDILIYNYMPEKIINKDLSEQIKTAAQKTAVSTLLKKIKAVEQTEINIKSNVNLRLALDLLMIRLSKGY